MNMADWYEAQIDRLGEAVERVRELHSQEVRLDKTTGKDFETGFCGHCWSYNGEYDTPYPCPTIKALDGELNG